MCSALATTIFCLRDASATCVPTNCLFMLNYSRLFACPDHLSFIFHGRGVVFRLSGLSDLNVSTQRCNLARK